MKYGSIWCIALIVMFILLLVGVKTSFIVGALLGCFIMMLWEAVDDIIKLLRELTNKKD